MIARLTLTLALPLGVASCAKIGTAPPRIVSDRVTSTQVVTQTRDGAASASVEQTDADVTVHATRACLADEVEIDTRQRITERSHFNESAANDWLFGIGGGLAAALGIVMLATPSSFASNGGTSAKSSGFSDKEATGTGAVLLALGVGLLVIPVIDAVRASAVDRSVAVTKEPGRTRSHDVPCPAHPYAGAPVTGSVDTSQIALGKTGDQGTLHVDLKALVPKNALQGPGERSLSLFMDANPIGHADLRPIARAYEDEQWRSVDPARCASQATADACATVAAFLLSFPTGTHAPEARAALQKYQEQSAKTPSRGPNQ